MDTQSSNKHDSAPAPAVEADHAVTPKMALASAAQPKPAMAAGDSVPIKSSTNGVPAVGPGTIGSVSGEAPSIELASVAAPQIASGTDELNSSASDDSGATEEDATEAPAHTVVPRISRFTMLAASLALSAALGGMAGVLAAYGLLRPAATSGEQAGATGLQEIHALKENVVQARVELAAIKVSIDAGNRAASAQFTRLGERMERVERMQAEPAAKLSKAIEALERISRTDGAGQRDVTGSITPPPLPAAALVPDGIVEGWVVRGVHRNTALIEGRMGVIEVDRGDVVPGLGRIEAFRKQDGRWVVVTTKGLIMSAR